MTSRFPTCTMRTKRWRAYGALCTPDFFGYDPEQRLRYRGRLDEGRTTPPPPNARRELVEAMRAIAQGKAPAEQIRRLAAPSNGNRNSSGPFHSSSADGLTVPNRAQYARYGHSGTHHCSGRVLCSMAREPSV